MPIRFPQCNVTVPDGALIGLLSDGTGRDWVAAAAPGARWIGESDPLDLSPARVVVLHHAMALRDAITRARARLPLELLRRGGGIVFLFSHEEDLLLSLSDEIWWLASGALVARGDPREVLDRYRRHVAAELRAQAEVAALLPHLRRGDGRARIVDLLTLEAGGQPRAIWQSGEDAHVRVLVRFDQDVDDPVIGIMIRTRIGFEVYGTNTELERLKLGPCRAGEILEANFRFRCDLCPGEYTLTAASHDPDGVWHDWMEDAVAFTVTDSRYTAGVANLRATVSAARVLSE